MFQSIRRSGCKDDEHPKVGLEKSRKTKGYFYYEIKR